jgi:hypothetical protein
MGRTSPIVLAACVLAGAWGLTGALARGPSDVVPTPDFPVGKTGGSFLRECFALTKVKRDRCYVRGLLAIVEKSGDPARELPRIDREVRVSGGYLASNCHILMHDVGRTWARRHGVTLETMFRYVPKSNDPGCSAGFGMGMVMHLGTRLILKPREVLSVCTRLPTRFREYTCVHGSGHAFMRGYHGQLESAVIACKSLGPRFTPDCAQGAFHDYWISLSGGDGTTRPKKADTDPRTVCRSYAYPRPCWYRFFWERRQSAQVADEQDLRSLCRGVAGAQRAGCMGGASLLLARGGDPVYHSRTCGRLSGSDALNCLRGVNVPALAGNRYEQIRLLRTCSDQPQSTRNGCYAWFGRTLNVVTNGRFQRSGCIRLRISEARAACVAGAHKLGEPLGTFS